MVYILLGTGFEEIEALSACDILRRAGVETQLAGIGGACIAGAHGIRVETDLRVEEIDCAQLEMIVLPGGLGGVESVLDSQAAMDAVRRAAADGKFVAAICAAPTVLAQLGLTDGRDAVCYPGMEDEMGTARMHPERETVTDGKLITGRAPGAAAAFALALVKALRGEQAARDVAAGLVYDGEI